MSSIGVDLKENMNSILYDLVKNDIISENVVKSFYERLQNNGGIEAGDIFKFEMFYEFIVRDLKSDPNLIPYPFRFKNSINPNDVVYYFLVVTNKENEIYVAYSRSTGVHDYQHIKDNYYLFMKGAGKRKKEVFYFNPQEHPEYDSYIEYASRKAALTVFEELKKQHDDIKSFVEKYIPNWRDYLQLTSKNAYEFLRNEGWTFYNVSEQDFDNFNLGEWIVDTEKFGNYKGYQGHRIKMDFVRKTLVKYGFATDDK